MDFIYAHPNHTCETCGGPLGIPSVGGQVIATFECMRDPEHPKMDGEWLAVPREVIAAYEPEESDFEPGELLDILFPPDHSSLRQMVDGEMREVAFVNTVGEFYDETKEAVDSWAMAREIESLNPPD